MSGDPVSLNVITEAGYLITGTRGEDRITIVFDW